MANNKPQEGKRRPTAKDWDKIRAMTMRGDDIDYVLESLPDVDISRKTIVNRMSKEGVLRRKQAIQEAVIDNLADAVEKEKIAVNNKCIKLFNDGSDVIDDLLKQYKGELRSGKELSKGQARATAYNIDMLMSGVTKIQKGLRVCYGMDEDGKLFEKEPEILVIDGLNTDKI